MYTNAQRDLIVAAMGKLLAEAYVTQMVQVHSDADLVNEVGTADYNISTKKERSDMMDMMFDGSGIGDDVFVAFEKALNDQFGADITS